MTDRASRAKPANPSPAKPGSPPPAYRVSTGTILADWPVLLLLLASLLAGVLLYPRLPEQVPSHWNLAGQVDRYGPRTWGAFGPPLLAAGIYALMLLVPLVDPRRENYRRFAGAYRVLRLTLVAFLVGLHAVTLLAAVGQPVRIDLWVPAAVSLLFIVLGNLMGQIRHNYFVGIRTPWTLASERVWQKTHRAASYAFVLAGLAGLLGLCFGPAVRSALLFGALGGAVLFATGYSYLVYRREEAGE